MMLGTSGMCGHLNRSNILTNTFNSALHLTGQTKRINREVEAKHEMSAMFKCGDISCSMGGSAIKYSNTVEGRLICKMSRPCMLVAILFFSAVSNANWFTDRVTNAAVAAMGFDATDTCQFTRVDVLKCIAKHVDYNHDKMVNCEEFERAKLLYMPPRVRDALWLAKKLGYNVDIKQLMYGCNPSRDCILTEHEFRTSLKTCLPSHSDWCKVKSACDIAEKSTEELTPEQWKQVKETCDAFPLDKCIEQLRQWDEEDKANKKKEK